MNHTVELEYVGFWPRVTAGLIDCALFGSVVGPLLMLLYGRDYFDLDATRAGALELLVGWILPAVAVVGFWYRLQATPGKMAVSAFIIDERTGEPASLGQHLRRYLGYFASGVPLGLGFAWIAFDTRKQGWHDKLAGTLVVRARKSGVAKQLRQ